MLQTVYSNFMYLASTPYQIHILLHSVDGTCQYVRSILWRSFDDKLLIPHYGIWSRCSRSAQDDDLVSSPRHIKCSECDSWRALSPEKPPSDHAAWLPCPQAWLALWQMSSTHMTFTQESGIWASRCKHFSFISKNSIWERLHQC